MPERFPQPIGQRYEGGRGPPTLRMRTEEIVADVPRYTDLKPVMQISRVVIDTRA